MRFVTLGFLALAGCAAPSVVALDGERYRVTAEDAFSAGGAEQRVAAVARDTCAARGKTADIRFAGSQTASSIAYATASADVVCR